MRRGRRILGLAAALAAVLAAPATAEAATWCGNDVQAANRLPDTPSGRHVHVAYAFPADGGDRFAELAHGIVSDVEAIDAWWRREDPTRAPRWDLFPFPGCAPGAGQLDLSRLQLPRTAAEYAEADTLFRIATDVGATPSSFTAGHAKYLVFYDGPGPERVCGQSYVRPDQGGRFAVAVVYVNACRPDLGAGGSTAWTTAHELLHNLGALPVEGPPNQCGEEPGHTCDGELDVMGPYNLGHGLASAVLDLGRDDYYAHGGDWWDAQDSPWLHRLDRPRVALAVTLVGGARAGAVSTDVPGIACPPACAVDWDGGSELELSAEPRPGFRFVRWNGGGCPRDGTPFCELRLDAPLAVAAVFGPATFVLSVRVTGAGRVSSSAGTACARSCRTRVDADVPVRLRARPARGWRFVRWAGACTGAKACTVRMSRGRAVTAVFRRV